MAKKVPKKRYNYVLQVAKMRSRFPQFNYKSLRNGEYIFIGDLQPTINSNIYTVKIHYRKYLDPKVYIINPPIADDCPHLYPSDKTLCLYNFEEFRWKEDYYITDYIIPWTCMWLYFYEIWLKTGKWYGEEFPHSEPKKEVK